MCCWAQQRTDSAPAALHRPGILLALRVRRGGFLFAPAALNEGNFPGPAKRRSGRTARLPVAVPRRPGRVAAELSL